MAKIILYGWIFINLPITILMAAGGFIAYHLGDSYKIGILIGGAVGWIYWSFTIPLWRKWALSKGVDEQKLEKYGVWFLLIFKKGSLLSKTEYRYKDK